MRKRHFLIIGVFLSCFLIWPQTGWTAQKILLAVFYEIPDYLITLQAFKAGLAQAAKQQGKELEWLELKQLDGNIHDFISKLKEIENTIDLVFVAGTPTAMAVLESGIKKPVLFAAVANPKKAKLVDNLHSPGRNFTGIYCAVSANRQLQTILSSFPEIKNITIIYNPFDPAPTAQVEEWFKAVMVRKDLDIKFNKIKIPEQVNSAQSMREFMNTLDKTMDILITTADAKISSYGEAIIQVANQNNIPVYSSLNSMVEAGALFSLGFKFKQAAEQLSVSQALRILNGTLPQDIPVCTLPEYNLVINLKTAKQIGIKFPEKILQEADQIIQ
ncbi:MAG: ABC transporter substrate-binding protein [Candidatus Omnitrophica bacterium]|nr:ABC transporter substrate-binding protein [Candidatus Omnitrophota bacterium]